MKPEISVLIKLLGNGARGVVLEAVSLLRELAERGEWCLSTM
jgi:hypothetical protein